MTVCFIISELKNIKTGGKPITKAPQFTLLTVLTLSSIICETYELVTLANESGNQPNIYLE
jgi:hypothetical protein